MKSLSLENYKIKFKITPVLYFLISGFLVALGQPAWFPFLGVLASICGYALFWRGFTKISSNSTRFWLSLSWFMATEAIHLSWMTATEFQGIYFYGVYLFVLVCEGLQFALLNHLLFGSQKALSYSRIGLGAGFWVWMEWLRLFFLCGFPFNPVGLSLTSSLIGMQNVSIAGIYGLSFWVMATNLMLYKYFENPSRKKAGIFALLLICLPYIYGSMHLLVHSPKSQRFFSKSARVLLVQTALDPVMKTGFRGFENMVAPIDQWGLIYQHVQESGQDKVDLIVLPETAVPLSHNTPYYSIQSVRAMVHWYFGERGLERLPHLEEGEVLVDNLYLSQSLANIYESQVVVGLEQVHCLELQNFSAHAAAFSLSPSQEPQVYHKQILIPLVEYIPFEWCKKLAKRFHIEGWFERGRGAVVFEGDLRVSPSICMEEMYGWIVRKNRLAGAQVLVNITNDAWYPNSKLPKQHFDHGILRAVENGVPLLRACNTGVTAGIDSLGRIIESFPKKGSLSQWEKGALLVDLPLAHHQTLYTFWGDSFVLSLSFLLVLIFIFNSIGSNRFILNFIKNSS